MKKVKSVKNPMIRAMYSDIPTNPLAETLTAYAVNGEVFSTEEFDIEVIVTKKVKPIADGTILHFKTWPYNIYVKNRGIWRYTDSRNDGLIWAVSSYNDEYIQESLDNGEATIINKAETS